MNKFIPIGKQSKKAQREYYRKRRNTWGSLNPVTRTVPNGKGYDRNKMKQEDIKNGRFSHNYEMRKPAIFYVLFYYNCSNSIYDGLTKK